MKHQIKRNTALLSAMLLLLTGLTAPIPTNADEADHSWNGIDPDLNGNGEIDTADATGILLYIAENGAGRVGEFSEFMELHYAGLNPSANPDLNSNDSIDTADATGVLRYIAERGASSVTSFAEFMETYYSSASHDELSLYEDILRNPSDYSEVWQDYNKNDDVVYSVLDINQDGSYEMIIAKPMTGLDGFYSSVEAVMPDGEVMYHTYMTGKVCFFDGGAILADFSGSYANHMVLNTSDRSEWFAQTWRVDTGWYEYRAYPCDPVTGDTIEDETLIDEDAYQKMAEICSGFPLDVQFTEYDLSAPERFEILTVTENLDEIRLTWDKLVLDNLNSMGDQDCLYSPVYFDNDSVPEVLVYDPYFNCVKLYSYSYSNLMNFISMYESVPKDAEWAVQYLEKENLFEFATMDEYGKFEARIYHLRAGYALLEHSIGYQLNTDFTFSNCMIDGQEVSVEEIRSLDNDYKERYPMEQLIQPSMMTYEEFLEFVQNTNIS